MLNIKDDNSYEQKTKLESQKELDNALCKLKPYMEGKGIDKMGMTSEKGGLDCIEQKHREIEADLQLKHSPWYKIKSQIISPEKELAVKDDYF